MATQNGSAVVAYSASANTLPTSTGLSTVTGNRIVVLVKFGTNVTLTSGMVTDDLGNTYTLDWSVDDGNVGVDAIADHGVYSTVSIGTGTNVVTFTPGGSASRIAVVAREYAGLGAHDSTTRSITRNLAGATDVPLSGNITPSEATGIVICFISATQSITSWNTGYGTDPTSDPSTGRFHSSVDPTVAASAQQGGATLAGAALWDCGVIWYPDAGGAPAASLPVRGSQMLMGMGR